MDLPLEDIAEGSREADEVESSWSSHEPQSTIDAVSQMGDAERGGSRPYHPHHYASHHNDNHPETALLRVMYRVVADDWLLEP